MHVLGLPCDRVLLDITIFKMVNVLSPGLSFKLSNLGGPIKFPTSDRSSLNWPRNIKESAFDQSPEFIGNNFWCFIHDGTSQSLVLFLFYGIERPAKSEVGEAS